MLSGQKELTASGQTLPSTAAGRPAAEAPVPPAVRIAELHILPIWVQFSLFSAFLQFYLI